MKRTQGELKVERSSGGLVAALDPAMRQRGGVWIGWPGARMNADETLPVPDGAYELEPVPLRDSEVKRYYHGFSNGTLWPLFHSLLERTALDRRDFEVYESVNALFARRADEIIGDDDLVWVHDYHLTRCPEHLRALRPNVRMAFFLHIPFPPFDLFRVLPWGREVLRGLLACDLIGFHHPGYVSNFMDCVERMLGERTDRDAGQIEHGQRTVQVGAFPLGIDYEHYAERARVAPRARNKGERILLGVDRLDYTKGIPERIRAYERLLELHPEHRGEVVFIQVAVPSREQVSEYQRLKRELDELVGRVNGRFGSRDWTPIRYIHRSVPAARLSALYRDADVGVVTPLRDGMNLVAKEFVASQVDEPGVLVLSRLAGAAETMLESLLVNPYNTESVVEALHQALVMPVDQREARMRALQQRERKYDLQTWLSSFLAQAATPRGRIAPVKRADFESWLGPFLKTRPLLLFLDFDGTLAKIASHPSKACLSPGMKAALEACAKRGDTRVAIISGRGLSDIREKVGLDDLIYAGNHGLEIEGPGLLAYRHPDIEHYTRRAKELAVRLDDLCEAGAWVEAKGASLTLHFREAPESTHEKIAKEASKLIREAGFQARDALCAVEARPPIGWDKGHAVLHVLRECYGPGWSEHLRTIYAGDDETDEDAFGALRGLGATFRVGPANQATRARRRLSDVQAVETLLDWLAARPLGAEIDRFAVRDP
jgi:trehalose 6-phosphate synthase/phosphatase